MEKYCETRSRFLRKINIFFRQINVLTKEHTKESISRKVLSMIAIFSSFPQCDTKSVNFTIFFLISGSKQAGGPRKMKSSVKLKSSLKNATADLYNMATTFTEKKLRMAASTNNTENLRKFLANGVNVNGSDGQKRTSLHFAASKGYSGEF